jgi:hypothetical protein
VTALTDLPVNADLDLTGPIGFDAYMRVLAARSERAYQPSPRSKVYAPPLYEWMVRDADERHVILQPEPVKAKRPARQRAPRRPVDVAVLRARRERLDTERLRLGRPISDDPAIASAGRRLHRQVYRGMDRDLERYGVLTRQIQRLDLRIAGAAHDAEQAAGGAS